MGEKEKIAFTIQAVTKILELAERYVVIQEKNYDLSLARVTHLVDIETRNAKSAEDAAKNEFKATVDMKGNNVITRQDP